MATTSTTLSVVNLGPVSLSASNVLATWDPLAINAQGLVVGSDGVLGVELGVGWSNGSAFLLPDPASGSGNIAAAINTSGQIAGEIFNGYAGSRISMAALWSSSGAQPVSLGELAGDTGGSGATGINNQGQVVGYSYATNVYNSAAHGFIWQNGVMTSLGTGVLPAAINDSGQVVGTNGGTPILWQNGVLTDLPTLAAKYPAAPEAINASGEAVGYASATDNINHAVFWKNGQITDLGVPSSVATSVNDSGIIVGWTGFNSRFTAVVWADGTVISLNDLLPAGSPWFLAQAAAINDQDQVVGTGFYHGAAAAFEITLPSALTVSAATATLNFKNGEVYGPVAVSDSGAGVGASLDGLQSMAAAGKLSTVTLTDSGTAVLLVSLSQISSDAAALGHISGSYSFAVTDSAANVQAGLDQLESLAKAGQLASITLSDGGIPTLTISSVQLAADQAALSDITGYYQLSIAAPAADATIAGQAGHANVLDFANAAAGYIATPSGDGSSFTLSEGSITYHLSGITALKFSDYTAFVASQTPVAAGGISSSQVADLYAAVFARTPDAAGLAYYQAMAAANPALPITAYAEDFLSSPEYTSNAAHSYAQNSTGDAQFIADTYANLLHRAPQAGDVAWYQANVIAPYLKDAAAGTAAYAGAELAAHAALLADFSQSQEFAADVAVTSAHPADAQHWLILI